MELRLRDNGCRLWSCQRREKKKETKARVHVEKENTQRIGVTEQNDRTRLRWRQKIYCGDD